MVNTAKLLRAAPKENRFTWSWRHVVPAAAIVLAVVACNDSDTIKGPTGLKPNAPNFSATDPFNSTGSCFSADVFKAGFLQQLKDSLGNQSLETGGCTANDIRIAQADIFSYSVNGGAPITFTPGDTVSCNQGDLLSLNLRAHVQETATSERTDIGIWIANDGGNARIGECKHFNLVNDSTGVSDIDSDQCGDMSNAQTALVQMGTIDAICAAQSDTSRFVHVGSCLGWTQPGTGGDDRTCPTTSSNTAAGVPAPIGPDQFRYGTTPGTTSKCNCEGFNIPFLVNLKATIELIKSCNPSTDPGTFDMQIDGSVGTFGDNRTCTGTTSTTGAVEVSAGTNQAPGADHTVRETDFSIDPSNYTSTVSCTKNGSSLIASQSYTAGTNLNIHVVSNDAVVCTFVNTRKPQLQLEKIIINNNGGTATINDFGIVTSAGTPSWTCVPNGTTNTCTSQKFLLSGPGSQTFAETPLTGYDAGTWSCSPVAASKTAANDGAVTLAAGDDVKCSITNDDKGSSLKLVKVIKNDNGGIKTVGDFGLQTSAGALNFTCQTVGTTTTCTSDPIATTPNTYTFSENNVAGYTEGTWSCSPKAAETSAFDGGSVVIGLGDNITCTIENNDDPGHLTLIKHVVNDNGGTKTVGDFSLTSNAGTLTPFTSASEGTNQTKYTSQTLTVNRGTKTFSESNVAGYTEGTWSCSPTAATTSAFDNGSVFIDNGVDVTCEITNNDDPGTLIIKKIVKGAGTQFDYTTSTATPTPLGSFSLNPPTDGTDQKTFNNLWAGAYSVTETVPPSYVLTDLSCDNDPTVYDPKVTQTVNATVANGETVTCTFINEITQGQTTRTQGFWATHSSLTQAAWFGGTAGGHTFAGVAAVPSIGDTQLCSRNIDTLGKLLGGFWSGISQTSTKKKRSDLDQARMQLLQQLLAAELNASAFGSSPSTITFAAAEAAYCGTDIAAIKDAQAKLAAFNEGGDSGVFTPGASANGKLAKSLANIPFWDVLP